MRAIEYYNSFCYRAQKAGIYMQMIKRFVLADALQLMYVGCMGSDLILSNIVQNHWHLQMLQTNRLHNLIYTHYHLSL